MAVDKLVDSTQLNADLTSVADAIRTKGSTSAQLAFPSGFISAVNAILTGGGGESIVVTDTTDVSGGIIRSIDGRVYDAETWTFTLTDDTTVTKVVDVYDD